MYLRWHHSKPKVASKCTDYSIIVYLRWYRSVPKVAFAYFLAIFTSLSLMLGVAVGIAVAMRL